MVATHPPEKYNITTFLRKIEIFSVLKNSVGQSKANGGNRRAKFQRAGFVRLHHWFRDLANGVHGMATSGNGMVRPCSCPTGE
jgi:hypothetical protein